MIVTPALTPQQNLNTRKAVAHARLRDLLDALPHGAISAGPALVAIDRALQKYGGAGTPLRHAILR